VTSTLGLYCQIGTSLPWAATCRLNGKPSTYRPGSGSILSWIDKTIPVDDLLAKNGHVTYWVVCNKTEITEGIDNDADNTVAALGRASQYVHGF
jgi:hypothetical protein